MDLIEHLVLEMSRLPGLGRKSATRIVYHLLRAEPVQSATLSKLIADLRVRIRPCVVCGNYTDRETCPLCDDPGRDRSLLCIVEEAKDIRTIEDTREFHGLYHVLGGAISPIDGVGPRELGIEALVDRVKKGAFQEVILATNPTVEGETTALYVAKLLRAAGARPTRLAFGLPMGGELEYADRLTLSRALRGRGPLE